MSDLTITNRGEILRILTRIQPYVIFKKRQVDAGLRLLAQLPPPKDPLGFLMVCQQIDEFSTLNFSKTRTNTSNEVRKALEKMGLLVPVTTDSKEETELRAT